MGNERATQGPQYANANQAANASSDTEVKVPGKSTLSEKLQPTPAEVTDVMSRVGTRVLDGTGAEYQAMADGSFLVTQGPAVVATGNKIEFDKQPADWKRLHAQLLAQTPASPGQPFKSISGTSLSLGGSELPDVSNWYLPLVPAAMQNAERAKQTEKKQSEEKNLVRSPVTGYGRSDQNVLGEDGNVLEAPTSGTAERKGSGTVNVLTGSVTTGTTKESYATNGEQRTTTRNGDTRTTDLGSTTRDIITNGTTVEVVDVAATASRAKDELSAEKTLAEQEIANKKTSPEAKKAAQARIAQLTAAMVAVDAASSDGAALKQVCAQQRLVIEPAYKVVEQNDVTEKEKLEWSVWRGSFTKSTDTSNTKTDNAGTMTTTARSTSFGANLSAGTLFDWEKSTSETKQNADASSETRSVAPTRKASLEAGGGELKLGYSTTDKKSNTTAAGETSSWSKQDSYSGSILAGDDGFGYKNEVGRTTTTTEGKSSKETELKGGVGYTDKGVLGDASWGRKTSDGKTAKQVKVSANGALLIEVLPPDDDSDQYRIVTTVRAGIGASGSMGDKKKEGAEGPQGTLSGSIKGSAAMVYTHVMSLEQAQKYMSAADSATAGKGGEFPEFDMAAKLGALVNGENSMSPRSVLGNSTSAAGMPAGDSMKLALSGSAEAKLDVKAGDTSKGIGASVSKGSGLGRTVTVSKNAEGMVIVAIGFEATDKSAASLSGSLEGASATIAASQSSGDGEEYTFMLDPHGSDYQARYEQILNTYSRDSLRKLSESEPMKGRLAKTKLSQNHNAEAGGGAGGAGVMLNNSESQFGSSTISKTPTGAQGTISGGQSQATSLSIADTNVAGVTHTNTATSNIDQKGEMQTDLQTADSESDLGKTLSNAGKTAKGWLGMRDGKETNPSDVIKGALEKTPGERLEELLDKQYTRLSGYKIREYDLAVIQTRAEDESKWMSACKRWQVRIPMENLRDQLLAPTIDYSLVTDKNDKVQVQRAGKVAVAKALADFMESSGAGGKEAIVNVMRNWGARFNVPSTAEVLGDRYEWPPSLAKHRVTFEKAEQMLRDVPRLAQSLIRDPNGKAQWHLISDKLIPDLDAVHAAVADAKEINSERARAEMLNDISRKKAGLVSANKYFDRAEGMEQQKDPKSARADAAEKQREGKAGSDLFANERVTTLLTDLSVLKQREGRLLAAGNQNASSILTKSKAHVQFRELCELYEYWVGMVKELRGHYDSAGVDPQTWQVSASSDAPRRPDTEPFVEGLIQLQQRAQLPYENGYSPTDLRSRFGSY